MVARSAPRVGVRLGDPYSRMLGGEFIVGLRALSESYLLLTRNRRSEAGNRHSPRSFCSLPELLPEEFPHVQKCK